MEEWVKRGMLVILILSILSPIGIILTWNCGDAWGEWEKVKVGNETWEPQSYTSAPFPDYSIPGWNSMLLASISYIISAFIGVSMCFLVVMGIAKTVEMMRE